jgi:hypothetical protein
LSGRHRWLVGSGRPAGADMIATAPDDRSMTISHSQRVICTGKIETT